MKRPKVTDHCETIFRAGNYKYIQAMEKYIDYLESEANKCNLLAVKRVCIVCGKPLKEQYVPPTCSTKCSKEYFKQT